MNAQRVRLSALVFGLLLIGTIVAPVAAGTGEHFRGRLVSYHSEDATMKKTVSAGYALEANGKHYNLSFRDTSLANHVGRDVELTGARKGRSINVAGYRLLPDGSTGTNGTNTVAATQAASRTSGVASRLADFW